MVECMAKPKSLKTGWEETKMWLLQKTADLFVEQRKLWRRMLKQPLVNLSVLPLLVAQNRPTRGA